MVAKKQHKLDLASVLLALDRQDMNFYSRLDDEEKKAYHPVVLMRYMSSLTDQSKNAAYAVIATNDIVNIGFWTLSKYPDLQHMLLCLAGIGGKQYRPWLSVKKSRSSNKVDQWIISQFPDMNEDELLIFKSNYDTKSWKEFLQGAGLSDSEIKALVDSWKKTEE